MTKSEILDAIFKINDKFREYKEKEVEKLHFETLHTLLLQIKADFKEDWWENNMPETVKLVYKKLEKAIYFQTSHEYQLAMNADLEKQTKTSNNTGEQKSVEPKRGKRIIGFAIQDNNLEP